MSRKHSSSQRAQTLPSMTTEYQERFLPPHCHTTVVSALTLKNHPLKGMGDDGTTFKSYYVAHKWNKNPQKEPLSSLPLKGHQRCSSAPQDATEDYTSVYQNDFREWAISKRQPCKLNDSLKVKLGLIVPRGTPKEGHSQNISVQRDANSKPVPQEEEPKPIESITSYRSHYITHPVQPRMRREKPMNQTNKGLLASVGPKFAWQINQKLIDGEDEFFQQFKTWSLETKFHGKGKAKVSSPPADHKAFVSTVHVNYKPHECQRTEPIQPSVQSREKGREPFHSMTSMKEDCKFWDTLQHIPIVHKEEMEQSKKTPHSVCTPKPAERCKTNPKPSNAHSKLNETAASNSREKLQRPAENGAFSGFESISSGTEESRMYWSTSLDRGVTWPDGDTCDDLSQPQQIISCMVSSRS
ncbi:stabilizer of axonemal microtubules 1-like [Toxotes jaculatrix]|uniref:stabilizer of axonemal microtubules 1-like n=1 Tax=Toxotes jaculatrix TaxID=941984 RepID=UPI001B3A9665|nr:stabilizer of axonemal microtubules 1-like [Toxotes jaculatrix]